MKNLRKTFANFVKMSY